MRGRRKCRHRKDRLRMYKFRMDRIRRRRGGRVWQEERQPARTEDAGAGEPGRKSGSARTEESTGAEHFARTGNAKDRSRRIRLRQRKMHGELHMRRIFCDSRNGTDVQNFSIPPDSVLSIYLDTDMIHVRIWLDGKNRPVLSMPGILYPG